MLRDHSGVKDAKPRLKTAKEELPELSREYLEIRNAQMRTKNHTAEMVLAQQRGELIQKDLVVKQAAFLLIAMRQRILNLPTTYARRLTGLKNVREVKKVLEGAAISILNEIKDLPKAVTDPNWLESLEEE